MGIDEQSKMTAMTRDQILLAFDVIRAWRQTDKRGPHKPLLVSRVSVRLPRREAPSSEFSQIDALTKTLKDEFWPSGAGKNDHLPFWFLAFDDDDGLWHLHGHAVLYPCLTRQPTPAAPKWRAVK